MHDGPDRHKNWRHSYRLGGLAFSLLALIVVIAKGGPWWPPYLLLAMIVLGALAGLATIAYVRQREGLGILDDQSEDPH